MNVISISRFQSIFLVFLTFLVLLFMFINTLGTDSGWIANTYKYIYNTKDLLFTATYVDISFGKFYFYLNSLLINIDDSYFTFRLFSFFLTLLCIYYYHRFIMAIFEDSCWFYFTFLLVILFGISTGIMIGIRQEGVYIPIFFMIFYFVFLYDKNERIVYLYICSILSSLASITHPNGLVCLVVLFLFVLILLYKRKILIYHIIFNTILILFILYYGFLWNVSLGNFIDGFTTIASDSGHTISFYKEYLRYMNFIRNHIYLLIPLIISFLGIYLFIQDFIKNDLKIKISNTISSFLVYGFLFVFLYLFFIGVKWGYYLSLLFPYFIIGFIYFIRYFRFDFKIIFFVQALLLSIILTSFVYKIPNNEEFLKLFNIPSQRVNIIDDISQMNSNKTILAPARTFFIFSNSTDFIQLEKLEYHNIEQKLDFVILDSRVKYTLYEKRLDLSLKYIRTFVYNGNQFNIFKVLK